MPESKAPGTQRQIHLERRTQKPLDDRPRGGVYVENRRGKREKCGLCGDRLRSVRANQTWVVAGLRPINA